MTFTEMGTQRYVVATAADLHIAVSRIPSPEQMPGLSTVERSMIGTIISELGHNILKYAGRGYLRVNPCERGGQPAIEISAHDAGPGIADIETALRDHYSSGGTLGLGLPGVRRMVDEFSIQSAPGAGTCVRVCKRLSLAPPASRQRLPAAPDSGWLPLPADALDDVRRIRPAAPATPAAPRVLPTRFDIAKRVRPHVAHTESGDQVAVVERPFGWLLAVIDVSGHGEAAATVARGLVPLIESDRCTDLGALLQRLHAALLGTRGAAVGLAAVERQTATLRYAGVGNTGIARLGAESWHGVSRDGVLGQRLPATYEQTTPLHDGDVVVLYSDGVRALSRLDLPSRVRLDSPAVMAQRLIQRFGRLHDDASCVVMKCRS